MFKKLKIKTQDYIKHIKMMFYGRLAVGLRKNDDICNKPRIIGWVIYPPCWNDEVYHKQLYDQIMTYIVTGKFNNKTFLMTDCVGTTSNGEHIFVNKLIKLMSTKDETYSTITGYDTFQVAINLFDKKCHENDMIFDVENEKHINEILEIYEHLKDNIKHDIEKNFLFSGLFFIERGKVFYYIIKKDENDKMYISGKNIISNNKIVEDIVITFDVTDNQFSNPNEIIDYCKEAIIKHYKRKNETKNLDLKDKFSFIMFNDDEKIKILPYINNMELILSTVGCKYDDLKSNR